MQRRSRTHEHHPEARLDIVLLLLGILLLLLALLDAFWTTVWVDRSAGPLSARLTTWVWRRILRITGPGRHVALEVTGPALLLGILFLWVLLLWAGWVFVFSSGDVPLLSTRDQMPPDWIGRIYFVGYTLSTMGNGDFQPNGGAWQIATALTSASGMMFITLAVSYVFSVIGAVVQKRAFAVQVSGMGKSAPELLRYGWNGRDFQALDLPLNTLSTQISLLSEQYLAYPVLHYYHPGRPERSPAIAFAMLDEALCLLLHGVPEQARPNPAVLHSVRSGVESYLDTLSSGTVDQADDPPPAPELAKLRELGIPTVSDEEFERRMEEEKDRRRKLLGLVRNDGWEWPEGEDRSATGSRTR